MTNGNVLLVGLGGVRSTDRTGAPLTNNSDQQ